MKGIKGIYTIRDTTQPYYWDVVYEWEDALSKALHVPLVFVGKQYDMIYKPSLLRKILNRLNFYQKSDSYKATPSEYYIAFHIGPPGIYSFHNANNVIPIIIDFWKSEDLKRLESLFALSKYVFVTSKEVYTYLIEKRLKIRIDHLALSLPDKLFTEVNDCEKDIDLIQIGRQNEILSSYAQLFCEEFPEINYVYSEKINGTLQMVSSKTGKLGEFKDRDSFLGLLRRSRISLLSAPGLDIDANRTGGFSPVTPRFLESAACGCHLIGIYPENDDFDYFSINKVCLNVKDYNSFKTAVVNHLREKKNPDHRSFLINHLTSKRAVQLLDKVNYIYAR